MSKVIGFIICTIIGGLFMNAKFDVPSTDTHKTEVIYGTRVGPDGNVNLVVTR